MINEKLKTQALFLSYQLKYLTIADHIGNFNNASLNPINPFNLLNKEQIMDIDNNAPEIAMYSLFDNTNNFYIAIPGTGLNNSGVMFGLLSLFQGFVFDTIECALGVAKSVDKYFNELHPKLMQNITKRNLKSINFAGHSFGGMQCPVYALIYALLIDFYKNHYNCTKDACCCSNEPIHPKITCKLLRGFVYKFYLYHYETGYLGMWNHSEAISSYKKDLYLNCHCKEAIKGKFNDLFNKSIDEVIHQMMKCDKELLENLVIENIHTFGSPATLSKEWANIYNAYFYNPHDIENSKHLSFQNEDDPFAGFTEEGGPYYLSAQFYSLITFKIIFSRSPIGTTVKIYNKSKLSLVDAHGDYMQSISFADHFEFYSNHKAPVNKTSLLIASYEAIIHSPTAGMALGVLMILLEIPYIIFTPILLIAKCFGANIFLYTHQIVISSAAWIVAGVMMLKFIKML